MRYLISALRRDGKTLEALACTVAKSRRQAMNQLEILPSQDSPTGAIFSVNDRIIFVHVIEMDRMEIVDKNGLVTAVAKMRLLKSGRHPISKIVPK
jgi:hypothetical protein